MKTKTTLRFVEHSGFVINDDKIIYNIIIYGSNGEIYLKFTPMCSEFTYLSFKFETKLKKKRDLAKNIPFYIKEDGRYNFYIPESLVDFTIEETKTTEGEIYDITTSVYRIFNIMDGVGHDVRLNDGSFRISITEYEFNDEYKKARQIAEELNENLSTSLTAYNVMKILRVYDMTKKK